MMQETLPTRSRSVGLCTQDGFVSASQRGHAGSAVTSSAHISNCTAVGSRGWPRAGGISGGRAAAAAGMTPLVVTGCARRIAEPLRNRTIPYLDALMAAAGAHRVVASVVLFHDDPTDNETLAVLQAWAHRERRVRLILSDMGARGERIQRLTLCRNVLIAEAAARLAAAAKSSVIAPQHAPQGSSAAGVQPRPISGYMSQIDLDCFHRTPDAMLSILDALRNGHPHHNSNAGQRFDVVTSNSPGVYRDMWALRSSTLGMDYDCFWDFKQMRRRGNCKKHRIYVNPSALPFEIESGFNGLAIYSAKTLVGDGAAPRCRYTNETRDPDSRRTHVVSEHVPYFACLRAAGVRIGLLPHYNTYCHDWATRHDAARTYYLANGTVIRLTHRAAKADPSWLLP